jgi:ribonuclease BN (tRNA processing enzyme)
MYASRDRAASGYLIECGDTSVWMDAGGGTWANLFRCGDYRKLDGILLSHRHPDHTIDVFQAFHARAYGPEGLLDPIPLWGPQEALERLAAYTSDFEKVFDLIPLVEASVLELGDARFTFTSMAHPPETLGIRVECEGAVLAYSADTGPGADFRRLAEDADVFLCEATFQDVDEEWEGHLHAGRAAMIAAEVGVQQLVLTHLPHDRDLEISLKEARAGGEVNVALAEDLTRLEVAR